MRSLFILFALLPFFTMAQERYLFVGTYTDKGSEGIYVYRFNEQTGALTPASVKGGIQNPSFLALSPDGLNLYAVSEVDPGGVNAYRFNPATGELTDLNSQPSNGVWPCYIAVDRYGRSCIVGNYGSGTVCVLPILNDGALGDPTQTIQHEGKGTNPERQEKAHVHSVNIAANNRDVFVNDLGMDKIMAYTLDNRQHRLLPAQPPFIKMKDGSGPRHFAYHPNGKFAYAILELDCTVAAFQYQNGALKQMQTISTLPADFTDKNTCADLHVSPDGKFLYGSNRGHNSIVIYKINPANGKLTLVGFQSTMGSTPRNFTIDPTGKFLLAANQDTGDIQVFSRNEKTGELTYLAEGAKVSKPVCLLFR